MKIETITKQHDRKNFDCGHEELNNYLRSTARQSDTKRSTRTWVLVDDDVPTAILGYITLVPSEQDFPEGSKAARNIREKCSDLSPRQASSRQEPVR